MPRLKKEKVATAPETNGRATDGREIIYPQRKALVRIGKNAMKVSEAKKFLDWEEETDEVQFGAEFLLIDENKKKVRCLNNDANRPFNRSWAITLAYEHLNRNWQDNGEAIVIGTTGRILSAQHRLIGLVLAEQIRLKSPDKWSQFWDGPVTMDTTVSLGVSEDSKVTRTLDNVHPRSLSDVLFCNPEIFGKQTGSSRKVLTRGVEHAVSLLWKRTGAYRNFFITKRTHSVAIDFIERHKTLLEIVAETFALYSEDMQVKTRRIGLGAASALHYMMACSESDGGEYRQQNPRHEGDLDWSMREKAGEFWTKLCDEDDKEFTPLRKSLALLQDNDTPSGGRVLEKIGTVIKGWDLFLTNKKMTPGNLKLDYDTETHEHSVLNEFPALGGIDLGEEELKAEVEEEEVEEVEEEEVEDAEILGGESEEEDA